jgi:predicted signal transduction protein with EAL and GGDEF domain
LAPELSDLDQEQNQLPAHRINDTHGHKVGGLLLVDAAQRRQGRLRAVDTVARFGGDEFVLLLGDLDGYTRVVRDQAEGIVRKILAALAESYRLAHPDGAGTVARPASAWPCSMAWVTKRMPCGAPTPPCIAPR